MAKVSRKCPYCKTKVEIDNNTSAVPCGNCGEYISRSQFPKSEDAHVPIDYELENARSLRAIAVSLQINAIIRVGECTKDTEDKIQMLQAIDDAVVEPFE